MLKNILTTFLPIFLLSCQSPPPLAIISKKVDFSSIKTPPPSSPLPETPPSIITNENLMEWETPINSEGTLLIRKPLERNITFPATAENGTISLDQLDKANSQKITQCLDPKLITSSASNYLSFTRNDSDCCGHSLPMSVKNNISQKNKLNFKENLNPTKVCGVKPNQGKIKTTSKFNTKAAIHETPLWSSNQISVCWEDNALVDFPIQTKQVETEIQNSIEKESNIKFYGWKKCEENSQGIRIGVRDECDKAADGNCIIDSVFDAITEQPSSHYPDGTPKVKAENSRPKVLDTGSNLNGVKNGMILNFRMQNWGRDLWYDQTHFIQSGGKSCDIWTPNPEKKEKTFLSISKHEFMHALGFRHEQDVLLGGESAGEITEGKFKGWKYRVEENPKDAKSGEKYRATFTKKISATYADESVELQVISECSPTDTDPPNLTSLLSSWDVMSIMNYCNPSGVTGNSELSTNDKKALRGLYSSPTNEVKLYSSVEIGIGIATLGTQLLNCEVIPEYKSIGWINKKSDTKVSLCKKSTQTENPISELKIVQENCPVGADWTKFEIPLNTQWSKDTDNIFKEEVLINPQYLCIRRSRLNKEQVLKNFLIQEGKCPTGFDTVSGKLCVKYEARTF